MGSDNSCLQHSNNMLSTIVVVCFMVASALGLEVINDQEMELVAIEEFLDLELAGKTAEDYFKENDVDGNGCFDFNEAINWFRQNAPTDLEQIAGDLDTDQSKYKKDSLFEATALKFLKEGVLGDVGIKQCSRRLLDQKMVVPPLNNGSNGQMMQPFSDKKYLIKIIRFNLIR